jgi:putative acetyltransferase
LAYVLRPFCAADAPAISALTLAAILQVGSTKYSVEQIAAWAGRHPSAQRFLDRASSGHWIWIAADAEDQPVAFTLLEPDGHLDMLYCHPDHTRKGLSEQLLAQAEAYARSEGLKRLYTEASELAVRAFERAGYTKKHRRDFSIEHDGNAITIHNYAMEKRLT